MSRIPNILSFLNSSKIFLVISNISLGRVPPFVSHKITLVCPSIYCGLDTKNRIIWIIFISIKKCSASKKTSLLFFSNTAQNQQSYLYFLLKKFLGFFLSDKHWLYQLLLHNPCWRLEWHL